MEPEITIRPDDPRGADAERCLRTYFADVSALFDEEVRYEDHPLADSAELRPPRGVFLVACAGERPVGCGVLTTLDEGVGYIQRMWVDASRRGTGLGSRLLAELERHARDFGLSTIRLYTQAHLESAQALYRRRGYREVEPFFDDAPYADHFFEKGL